jgi:hypothetical protein
VPELPTFRTYSPYLARIDILYLERREGAVSSAPVETPKELGHIRNESTECVINTADIDPRYRHVFSLARLQLEAAR